VIHIEDILRNIAIYFNFQNMTVLCDSNAEKPKFRFSASCGYPTIGTLESQFHSPDMVKRLGAFHLEVQCPSLNYLAEHLNVGVEYSFITSNNHHIIVLIKL
jgi:hypothetical protein